MHVLSDRTGLAGGDVSPSSRWKARALQTGEQQRPGSVKTLAPGKLLVISDPEVLTQT